MVQTPSHQAEHPKEDMRGVGAGARVEASGTVIPTISLADCKVLRRQNEEKQKALGEIMTLFQQFLLQEFLSPTLYAYA